MRVTISHRKASRGFWADPETAHVIAWPDALPLPVIGDRIDWLLDKKEQLKVRGRVIGRSFSEVGVVLFVEENVP